MKRYLLFGDCHLEQKKDMDYSYALFKKVARNYKPDGIICLGDLMDFQYISKFADPSDVEGKRLSEDMNILNTELDYFQKCLKKGGELIYLSGNHEDRLLKLLRNNPVLSGLIDLKSLCESKGIKFIGTEQQPYLWLDTLYITHGLGYGKHFCSKLVSEVGNNIISGHTHRTQSFTISYPNGDNATAFGIGSLTELTEEYEKGKRITAHSNSFGELLLDEDTGYWQLNTIFIHDGFCICNNKIYTLVGEE